MATSVPTIHDAGCQDHSDVGGGDCSNNASDGKANNEGHDKVRGGRGRSSNSGGTEYGDENDGSSYHDHDKLLSAYFHRMPPRAMLCTGQASRRTATRRVRSNYIVLAIGTRWKRLDGPPSLTVQGGTWHTGPMTWAASKSAQ